MPFRIDPVRLSEINTENQRFQITTDRDQSSLRRSVREIGLVTPPVLYETGTDLIVISGFRRIQVCRDLTWSETKFRILPSNTAPLRLAQIAIAENSFQRNLNIIELSRAYRLLCETEKNSAALSRAASSLHLPGGPDYMEKLLPLSRLPESIQRGILSETLPLPIALELAKMDTEEGASLAEFFLTLRPSLNKQREMLGMAREIAARDELSVWEVFQATAIQEAVSEDHIDRNQKINRIRRHLKHRRFPTLARAEDRFHEIVDTLKLEPGIQLNPPPFFEGTVFHFSLRFSRLSELAAGKKTIDRILQSSDFCKYLT